MGLAIALTVTEKAKTILGVCVGLGVLVGGTSENGVSVARGVNVGRGVSLGVNTSVGLAVQVGSSFSRVGVSVGTGWLNTPWPGRKGLNREPGSIKTSAKYATRQAVRTRTRIESMSHICMAPPAPLVCVPSKSNSSF